MATAVVMDDVVEKTERCCACKGVMHGRRENYQYTECGLTSVVLMNIIVYRCKCGTIMPEIPASAWLHRQIAIDLLKKDSFLSGEELKFVRKVAGYSATELSRAIGVRKNSISRWENGKANIGKTSDRIVRLACFTRLIERSTSVPDDERISDKVASMARMVSSLTLTKVLEKINEVHEGSKALRIDPSHLGEIGLIPDRAPTSVIQ